MRINKIISVFVISLCIAVTSLAHWEDNPPPWFSCYCENSAFVSWFTSSSPLNPSDQPECYEYNPKMDPEQNQNFGFRYYDDAFKWLGAYESRWSVMALWVDGEEALVMPLPVRPENPGDKPFLTLYVQCIFHGDELGPEDMEIDLEIWNSPDYEQSPETIGQYVGGDFPELVEVWDLENGWCLAAYSATFSPEDYPGIWDATHSHVFLVGLENVYFDDILVDMLWHEEPQPPDSCYSPPPPTSFVSNPKPQYGQEHMRCDVNEICFQEPFIASFGFGCRCGSCVGRWRSILEGPFDLNIFFGPNDTNLQLIESLTDFNSPNETCVDIGPTLPGTTYYWRVDINDYNSLLSCEGFIYPFTTWGFAMNPEPADKAENIDADITLNWKNDGYASWYDAYLYDENDILMDANFGLTVDQNFWNPSADLAFNTSYLWRVDECNIASCFEGEKWSFTTGLCETLEDFESYIDSSDLRSIWKDSISTSQADNGAVANLITTADGLVYQGSQSMQINFDRSDFTTPSNDYVERLYVPARDFTFGGGKSINIVCRSDDVNAPEPGSDSIYMELVDTDANSAKIYYPSQVNDPCWSVWYIALSEISDAGADPCNINKIRIGAEGPADINNFSIYLDLLQRCTSICPFDYGYPDQVGGVFIPPFSALTADITGPADRSDCLVDPWDYALMAVSWLDEDYTIVPQEPNADFLFIEYLFDAGNSNDTSGNGIHGIDTGSPSYANGKVTFDGGDYIEIPFAAHDINNPFGGENGYTVAIDVNITNPDGGMIFSSAREPNCVSEDPEEPWDPEDPCSEPYLETHPTGIFAWEDAIVADRYYMGEAGMDADIEEENRVVHTYDPESEEHILYVNGESDWVFYGNPEVPEPNEDTVLIGSTLNCIYPAEYGVDNMIGTVDNVRVYTYPFSYENMLYYNGITDPFPVPVDPLANFYATGDPELDDGDIIDFLDHAVIADQWLKQSLWPQP